MTAGGILAARRPCREPAPKVSLAAAPDRPGEAKLRQGDDWESLLAAANRGDGRAFAQFLRRVTPMLRGLIRARGAFLPPDRQEDVLQEVLLAIHLKRQSWKPGSPVRPWLYAVARYKVIDAFRSRGAEVHLPIEDFADLLEEEPTGTPLAARDADQFLSQIDGRSAALVRAVALEGETAETAGARLGLTAGAARVALHRAMRRLADLGRRTKE